MRGAVAAAILGALAWAASPAASPGDAAECPQVFHVYGGGSAVDTLDLLVLPDGFTGDELDLYRCGVALLFDDLLKLAPFDRVADSINVYRIDLRASREGVEIPPSCTGQSDGSRLGPFSGTERVPPVRAACSALAARTGLARDTLGAPVFPAGAFCERCTDADLDFFHDPEVDADCRVLWTDRKGLRRIRHFTRCAPKADVAIVVTNSTAHAGAGLGDSHPPIAVVTLEGADRDERRAELLGHELGHALGLLDEYAKATGEPPDFVAGRNVSRRSPDGPIEPPPWAGDCVNLRGEPVESCLVVRECGDGLPPEQQVPRVGLLEGAFYHRCDYFRASESCLMDQETEFCAACRAYLERLFRELGLLSGE